MGTTLDRIKAKITRAEQHIQDFQLTARAFVESGPYEVSIRDDAQTRKHIYYVSKVDAVPDALAAIAADVVQNLRSPLDQMAYQLVLAARSGAEPNWAVYYPIAGSAAHYPTARDRKIKRVGQEVIDAIDATEPYKGGKGHALWQLNELNKPDKHELLISAGGYLGGVDVSEMVRKPLHKLPGSESVWVPPMILRTPGKPVPLNVGDELFKTSFDSDMKENLRPVIDITINEPGVIDCEPALKTLHDMLNLVRNVIDSLGRFLP